MKMNCDNKGGIGCVVLVLYWIGIMTAVAVGVHFLDIVEGIIKFWNSP